MSTPVSKDEVCCQFATYTSNPIIDPLPMSDMLPFRVKQTNKQINNQANKQTNKTGVYTSEKIEHLSS